MILKLYFITESDCRSRCLRFLLWKVPVVSLIIDFFAQESTKGSILVFYGYFIINFLRLFLGNQIFRVLLEHFISEVVRK